MALKPADRDNLLVRLDERTNNIWRAVEQLEKHNREQNSFILQALTKSSTNRTWLKIGTPIITSAILFLAGLITKIMGLW